MKRSILHSPWTVTIVGGAIAAVAGGILLDWLKIISLDPLWTVLAAVWRWLVQPIGVPLVLLVGLVLVVTAVLAVAALLRLKARREPDFTSYTSDGFFDVLWQWTWCRDVEGRFRADSFVALCPRCHGELILREMGRYYAVDPVTVLQCSICRFETRFSGLISGLHTEVRVHAEQKARTGKWRETRVTV